LSSLSSASPWLHFESAVVVYLRELYYQDGFTVALKLIDRKILQVEIVREAATLIMIAAVARLAGKTRYERVAYFLLCFAVWDIFYYVWLKAFIGWPASFFEWDILFLIPITWLGPVLSPIICSFTMIVLAIVLLRSPRVQFNILSGSMFVIGCFLILYTYMSDYVNLLLQNDLAQDYLNLLQNKKFITLASAYLPHHYRWSIFWLGEICIGIAIVKLYTRPKAFRILVVR